MSGTMLSAGEKPVTSAKYTRKSTHPDGQCGCGPSCSPRILQWLRWPPFILAYICCIGTIIYLNNSYFGATLSHIERRFGLSSDQSAFLAYLNDLSACIVVVPLCFIADRTSRPAWLTLSLVLMAIGNFMTVLPHYLSEPLDTEALISGIRSSGSSNTTSSSSVCTPGSGPISSPNKGGTCEGETVGLRGLIWWAIIGQFILGLGQAGVAPIFLPYLDDLAGRNRRLFATYYGIFCSVWVGGPALGYFLGSTATSYYVDFDRIPEDKIPYGLSQFDPRWIGAWWMGFLAASMFLLLAAFIMPLLPVDPSRNVCPKHQTTDELKVDNNNKSDDEQEKSKTNKSIKETWKVFLPVFKRITRRPVLLFYYYFRTVELACIGIVGSFTVKYFTNQFGISAKRASFLNGAVLVPAAIFGLNLSSGIIRYYKLTLKQCSLYVLINNVMTLIFLLVGMFIYCETPQVAGINRMYSTSIDNSVCNMDCGCNGNIFRPVCGTDGVSYLTSCHAGCEVKVDSDSFQKSYTNCTCVETPMMFDPDAVSDMDFDNLQTAESGLCTREGGCHTQLILMVLIFGLLTFSRVQDDSPMQVIALGNTELDARATMFGFSALLYKVFGLFPAPIYFGAIVNTTCTLWQYNSCGQRGACWLYDLDNLRYAFFGINIALRVVQLISCIGLYFTVKETLEDKSDTDDEKKVDGTLNKSYVVD